LAWAAANCPGVSTFPAIGAAVAGALGDGCAVSEGLAACDGEAFAPFAGTEVTGKVGVAGADGCVDCEAGEGAGIGEGAWAGTGVAEATGLAAAAVDGPEVAGMFPGAAVVAGVTAAACPVVPLALIVVACAFPWAGACGKGLL
jgi:hypothetical protein